MDYKKAGVDIEAGYKSVELMKEHISLICYINKTIGIKVEYRRKLEIYKVK